MKFNKTQAATAAACSVMLIGAGVAVAAPAVAPEADAQTGVVVASGQAASGVVNVASVEGTFAFTQDAVTPTAKISQAFVKSAARLCNVTPAAVAAAKAATVSTDQPVMTLAEAQEAAEEISVLMACACSSNLAGGNIVANAQVAGMPIAQLLAAL